jgi:hypothetical protein
MTELQPGTSQAGASATRPLMFETKIPSAVTFGIGVLLFFMPFVDIKCNNMILQNVSGVQLATGFQVDSPGEDNSIFGDMDKNDAEESEIKMAKTSSPNAFALAALVLAVLTFVLALVNNKTAITGAVISSALCVVALFATMIDIKRKIKLDLPGKTRKASGLDKFGEGMYIAVDFTPWFYITIIAFGLGAWFCYRRMNVNK